MKANGHTLACYCEDCIGSAGKSNPVELRGATYSTIFEGASIPVEGDAASDRHGLTYAAAVRIALIACTADSGCTDCAANLLKQLRAAFPEHAQAFEDAFIQEFDRELGPTA